MVHLLKIKCVDSRVNVHNLAPTRFTLTTVQVPNLALTRTKRIGTLLVLQVHYCSGYSKCLRILYSNFCLQCTAFTTFLKPYYKLIISQKLCTLLCSNIYREKAKSVVTAGDFLTFTIPRNNEVQNIVEVYVSFVPMLFFSSVIRRFSIFHNAEQKSPNVAHTKGPPSLPLPQSFCFLCGRQRLCLNWLTWSQSNDRQ